MMSGIDDQPLAGESPTGEAVLDLTTDAVAARVETVLAALDVELVGSRSVLRRVREVASTLQMDRARRRFDLTPEPPSPHMSFTGGPGTGKTLVAMRMAQMLFALGYTASPRIHAVTRDDLVDEGTAHRGVKTRGAIDRAKGGVLFVDEAFLLDRPSDAPESDSGEVALDVLLQTMDDRSDLVVILAGLPDRMSAFLAANPDLRARVVHHVEFEDYDHAGLMQIADRMLASAGFRFDVGARDAFAEYLTLRMEKPKFANARSVHNAIERCRLRQARRLMLMERPLTRADLILLTTEDVYGSSVFGRERPAADPG